MFHLQKKKVKTSILHNFSFNWMLKCVNGVFRRKLEKNHMGFIIYESELKMVYVGMYSVYSVCICLYGIFLDAFQSFLFQQGKDNFLSPDDGKNKSRNVGK